MSTTLSTASIMYVDHDNVFKQHNATPVTIKVNRRFNGEVRKSFRCTIPFEKCICTVKKGPSFAQLQK